MGKEAEDQALILATGDIIIDEPDPYSFFEPSREFLAKGDFVIGQIEVPHTDRGNEQYGYPGTTGTTGKLKSVKRLRI